jgi:DNA polymerase-3 subunit alpha
MYAERTAELGQSALAITDHGTLSGVLYHVQACEAVGVKPIVGMEAYFRPDVEADREAKAQYDYTHLVLLAKNYEGFNNLMQLSTWAWQEGFYSRPAVQWDILRKHSAGLIASSSCVNGYLPRRITEGDDDAAMTYIRAMLDIFGEDFYLEIQPHDFDKQKIVNAWLCDSANDYGVPIVAAADAHYPHKGWHTTQQVMLMMKNIHQDRNPTEWLMSEEELHTLMATTHPLLDPGVVAEAVRNSKVIADRCEHYQIDKSPKIPKATKSTLEAERILREWCTEGLERIGKSDDPEYQARVETEFKTLRKLKVMDYFVIVGDMVRWAKSEGIRVGPGRGSAAGCLINYLIGITAVDPIGYGLLFERFMNDYRTELPDIDIDFQDDRRDEVKQYLRERWGEDYVVDIAAFQSFSHKSSIKDVGRALEIPFPELEGATKTIPDVGLFGVTLEDLEQQEPRIAKLFEDHPILKLHATRLFGQIKGLSRHAAAVIVTNRPASEVIPMMRDQKENMVTQWSERADAQLISPYGFLKIDCLSSSGLTIQDHAVKLVKKRRGIEYDFEDIHQFPVNESPDFAEEDIVSAFADGALLGIFQFGASHGIKALLREIKPTSLEHIIAANALYRPGTLSNGMADEYARRKNGKSWDLAHPSLEPFLAYTYGIMVFQEQVMQMYQALGKDVLPAESAIFLKVVGKGIARDLHGREKVQKYYDKFAAGCEEKGIPKRAYDEIWDQILQMTTYAFNKSHSTGYALQAYQDMFLKQRATLEEYSALLTVESKDAKKIPGIIRESKLFGISIKPPDVNSSGTGCWPSRDLGRSASSTSSKGDRSKTTRTSMTVFRRPSATRT